MTQTQLKSGGAVLFLSFTFFLLHPTHCLAFLDCPDMGDVSGTVDIQAEQDMQSVEQSHDHHSAHNDLCGNLFSQEDETWEQLLNDTPTSVSPVVYTPRDLQSRTDAVKGPRIHSPTRYKVSTSRHLSLNVFLC